MHYFKKHYSNDNEIFWHYCNENLVGKVFNNNNANIEIYNM